RDLARRIQQALGAPCADARRDRAADHRWAGARPGRPPRIRDRPAAPLLAPVDLAQSAAALRGLRGEGARGAHHSALCRRIPAAPESRLDRRSLPRALGGGRAVGRSEGVAAAGGVIISSVVAGLVPATPTRRAQCLPKRDRRDIRAFTPVLTGYARR